MEASSTPIEGLVVIKHRKFPDNRGFFYENYNKQAFAAIGINENFVQDNCSTSSYGTVRGMHMQHTKPQAKLISCLYGCITDIVIDARFGSPTYGQHYAIEISSANNISFFVPSGFLHGFCVTSKEGAIVLYKVNEFYNPAGEIAVNFQDSQLNLPWPEIPYIVSPKDQQAMNFGQMEKIMASLN